MGSGGLCIESWWRAVVVGSSRRARLWWPLLWLLSLPWGAVVRASHLLYRHGILRARPARLPVVSVGNLSVGGTGKTTVCMYLAGRLMQLGLRPAIVLRGHRRRSAGLLLVSDTEAILADPSQAGDEAWLLAKQLPGCPVAVATRREPAIRMLAEQTPAQVVLLDDGFQYYRLARQVDLVLLDAHTPTGSYRLFPVGLLREPLSHLARATDIWITHVNLASDKRLSAVERIASRYVNAPVLTEHAIERITTWEGEPVAAERLRQRRLVAVAGIGNPESFFDLLQQEFGCPVTPLAFPDHHDYDAGDWLKVAQAAGDDGNATVLTTPKDAVKLPAPPAGLEVFVVHPQLRVQKGGAAADELLQRIRAAVAAHNDTSPQRARP